MKQKNFDKKEMNFLIVNLIDTIQSNITFFKTNSKHIFFLFRLIISLIKFNQVSTNKKNIIIFEWSFNSK